MATATSRAGHAGSHQLTAKQERRVLELLQEGRSNLAIVNHYSTQDMNLTLEQVNRIRELSGLGPASSPSKPVNSDKGKADVKADLASYQLTRETSIGGTVIAPLKRQKSMLASTSAKTISTALIKLTTYEGANGTILGMAMYFIFLYSLWILGAHLLFRGLFWILAHKILTFFLVLLGTYLYLVFVRGEPLTLSMETRETARSSVLKATLFVLLSLRHAVEWTHRIVTNQPRPPSGKLPEKRD